MSLELRSLYDHAIRAGVPLSGFYNDNVRVETASGPVVVRIPIAGADGMDLRVWPESEVISAISPWVDAIPGLLGVCDDPVFQVHQFIDGVVVDSIAPRGIRVPAHLPADVVRLFTQLTRVPPGAMPALPPDWPGDGECSAFARRLSDVTEAVWEEFSGPFAHTYNSLGFPADPLAAVRDGWADLTPRPFTALHCDVHRKNLLVRGGRTWFLDWELALWGDPVYDLAVHLHKMGYQQDEVTTLSEQWRKSMPAAFTHGAASDIETYLRHERVKSAIVDTVRYAKLIRSGAPVGEQGALVRSLTSKLQLASQVWGTDGAPDTVRVLQALRG